MGVFGDFKMPFFGALALFLETPLAGTEGFCISGKR